MTPYTSTQTYNARPSIASLARSARILGAATLFVGRKTVSVVRAVTPRLARGLGSGCRTLVHACRDQAFAKELAGRALTRLPAAFGLFVAAGLTVDGVLIPVASSCQALGSLAARSVYGLAASIGPAGAVLAGPLLLTTVSSLVQRIRHAGKARAQEALNYKILFDSARQPDGEQALEDHARALREAGIAWRAWATRRTAVEDKARYALCLLSPVMALPTMAVMASVPVAAVLPMALGLGALGCGLGWLIDRADRWRDYSLGMQLTHQAEAFSLCAETFRHDREDAEYLQQL